MSSEITGTATGQWRSELDAPMNIPEITENAYRSESLMKAESIELVAVVGLGTMGHGIAQCLAAAGCRVRCYDRQAAARDTLAARVRANLEQMVEAGIGDGESVRRTLERIELCPSESSAVDGAQFVTEAVAEDLELKQEMFARIELQVPPETILASNSSSFPITQIATAMRHPQRAVLTHWFNPPHIVPVVEVVPGKRTDQPTTRTAVELLKRIGKLPVKLNQEIPGFLVNRVQVAMYREIWDLLQRGIAEAEEIDRAVRGSMGFRLAAIGPLAVNDFAGLDVTCSVYRNLVTDMRCDKELHSVMKRLLEEGRFGVKTGGGIYDYTPESIQEKQAERDRRYLALLKLMQDENDS